MIGPQNPYAYRNPAAFQNPYTFRNPYASQNPYASGNPYAFQNPYAAQNRYAAQNPYAMQNPYAYQNPYANLSPYEQGDGSGFPLDPQQGTPYTQSVGTQNGEKIAVAMPTKDGSKSASPQVVYAMEGDDQIGIGEAGTHFIDGGAGNDTVFLLGKKTDYSETRTSWGFILTDQAGNMTLLRNVENVNFFGDIAETQKKKPSGGLLGGLLGGGSGGLGGGLLSLFTAPLKLLGGLLGGGLLGGGSQQ